MVFEDDMIPKAELATGAWNQAPLTGKEKGKKSEHIRLKKKNNPTPLDNSALPDSFHFTQYPF